jgi:alpha-galactosidase
LVDFSLKLKKMKNTIVSFIFFLFVISTLQAQKYTELAATPPMGWSSWNYFLCDGLNEKVIKEMADAMVSSGMKEAGYQYINIDDCWQISRDENGNIVADSVKFPSGIKAVADYVHSRGLKFGIYTCAGLQTCAKRPGSRGYEYQDMRTYAAWDVDYVKIDWCNTDNLDAPSSYKMFSDAIRKAGRPMILSICEWGVTKPWKWAKDIGHSWRTTGDIADNFDHGLYADDGKVWGGGVLVTLDMQRTLQPYSGKGQWNDMDMLQVGNGGMTFNQNRSHFSLWAMMCSPLMAGNDLRKMTDSTKSILTNKAIIALNQDALGKQAEKIIDEGRFQIFRKDLSNGEVALCFFNRSELRVTKKIDWQKLNISNGEKFTDLWTGKQQLISTVAETSIEGHGVWVIRINSSKM